MLRMSDIARRAGVSQSTVSFVLNGRDTAVRISDKTRQKVLLAADELGYRQNQLARAMRTGNSQMLGFLGGDLCDEHVGRMLDGALQEAEAHGFTLKILPHRQETEGFAAIRRSSELRLMGVAALHLPRELVHHLHEESLHCNRPMVLLDTPVPLADVPQVATDDAGGVRTGVKHLVELGHTRIALVSSSPISVLAPLREEAFRRAMAEVGLPFDEANLARGNFSLREPNVIAAHALLDRSAGERPTGILCLGDAIAATVMQVASELGLRVPHDVSVLGFGDLNIAALCNPPLTTLRQPFRQMGRLAVRHLLHSLPPGEGEDTNGHFNTAQSGMLEDTAHLPVELVVRSSCAPPPV
ncbi:HTH-type transcriptional regulator DegA [Abditibacteriota bacterium]|nr:HTH-type transcriptional regulator DegA [Abditibacteriota bacterium]